MSALKPRPTNKSRESGRRALKPPPKAKPLVGLSKSMNDLKRMADDIADFLSVDNTMNTVLVTGDSGTGKTIFVDLIRQRAKDKSGKRSLALDCSTIEPNLIRSELFGYLKGAFTGAVKDKEGLLKQAEGCILFLDEIGNLSKELQSALLSALEHREVMPVGGSFAKDQYKTNFGLICATNKNVKETDQFSKELYYRIALWHVEIPPLSERKIDIIPFICDILSKHGESRNSKKRHCWSLRNLYCLVEYDWKEGGYRELEQEILHLLRNGTLSNGFYSRFSHQIDREPIIEKDMTLEVLIDNNGQPEQIKYAGNQIIAWYYRRNPERTYKAVFTKGILDHLVKQRFLIYLDFPDKTNISSSSRLHDRLKDVAIYIMPEDLLELIRKEIEYYETYIPSNVIDPRISFDSALFFMGLMSPDQKYKPDKYIPYTSFRFIIEEKHPTQHEEQIKKHFEFPEDSIPRPKGERLDIPEMKSSMEEQRIMSDLLLKYGYAELNEELMKLLLKQKYLHGTPWEELKKSSWFAVPYEAIDPSIRDFVKKINELPYVATSGSCAGHTEEEWRARDMVPPPPDENHAYVSVYVPTDRRRDFLKWLKEHVDIEEVDIHMQPIGFSKVADPFLGGSFFERWWPTRDEAFTSDKVFNLSIVSKKLHMPLKVRYGGFTTFNGISKERYYLNFNKDEIFKALIASEGHFRNFTELKEDKKGFLNCIVKHLADAEGHCDEAISHALIAENEETSRSFLELRDNIRDLRRYIQSSPITRDEGIREIRQIRRNFEAFNQDYDISKCETCGDPEEVMEEITRILNDLKKTPLEVAPHEPEADEFILMERDMAEKLIEKLSDKYGVEPPKLVISEDCHEPNAGLYSAGQIMVCRSGVNLHVLAHEFWHHIQRENGMHMDEGEAERFAVDLFKQPIEKGLYALHNHSHSEGKMVKNIKDVAVVYGGQNIGQGIERAMQWVDTQYPEGVMGIQLSLLADIIGALGGVAGALYLGAPWDLLAALVGGHLSTDLWRHAEAMIMPLGMPVAVPPSRVYSRYTVKPQTPIPQAPVPRGRYQITG